MLLLGKIWNQMTAILIGFVLLYGLFFSMGESADSGFWQSANFFAVLIGIMFNYIGPISYGEALYSDGAFIWIRQKGSCMGCAAVICGLCGDCIYLILFGICTGHRMDLRI